MKKSLFLFVLCMLATVLPAQKKMYVWVNEVPVEYSLLDVDSITFADAEPGPSLGPQPLQGVFSVSANKQVQFAPGNLQYMQSTQEWSFAAKQYEVLGTANVADGTLADKIDLFGWSGNTATAKWGIGTSEDNADYSGDFADWGQNIGDSRTWRTLTNDEWTYVRSGRDNANTLMGVARINIRADGSLYADGLILLPDNWTTPDEVSFKSGFASEYSVKAYADHQTFTLSEWRKLEAAGAVFLPASGGRYGSDVKSVQYGYYCSATPNDLRTAYYLSFNSYFADWDFDYRSYGHAVRLVKDLTD